MKLTRLRLVGFKSFVDPSDFIIEAGLTGVVGPNGCGKSNLVEALRWVMGENSYKALRATEMDDVIFAGSKQRPARNTAEVVLALDNRDRTAPAPWTELDELEVVRRIERDKGSTYRVNGREVRARDVQLLFADASTGARSPALVRQGQIGEIINAKPESRRRVLEEAAGIAGLHARRHEAELRLRTAEQNLTRVEDVLNRLQVQIDGLKKQARQAVRYRQYSAAIRALEASLLERAHAEAVDEARAAAAAVTEAERLVADRMAAQGKAARDEGVAAHQLPELREQAAACAAALERIRRAGEDLDREERQARDRHADLVRQIATLASDVAREEALARDAADNLDRLRQEAAGLADDAAVDAAEAAARQRLDEAERRLREAEDALGEINAELAGRRGARDALSRALREASSRLQHLEKEAEKLATNLAALDAETASDPLQALAVDCSRAEAELQNAENALLSAESAHQSARDAENAARLPFQTSEAEVRGLEVEAATLRKVLHADSTGTWIPVVDALTVARGYETALGAALADDLDAPLDLEAPAHWRVPGPGTDDPALPEGAEPLAAHVQGPAALARRLAQIGVVEADKGAQLQQNLRPGQRLVSRGGDLWRWDGFTSTAQAPSAAARRLAEKNRLAEIEAALIEARKKHEQHQQHMAEARAHLTRSAEAERAAREAVRRTRQKAEQLRARHAAAERASTERAARRAGLVTAQERLAVDIADAKTRKNEQESALAAMASPEAMEEQATERRRQVERARALAAEARAAGETFVREREQRHRRREAIAREIESWTTRSASAAARVAELGTRREALENERRLLEDVPSQVTEKRRALLGAGTEAEARMRETADRLALAEAAKSEAERTARAALAALSEAREQLARAETRREAADARVREARARILETLGRAPEGVAQDETRDRPSAALAEELDRLRRERERLGAVNLRAEDELAEVSASHDTLIAERDDLVEAIRRLRQGIQTLNREGRGRLAEAFTRVNDHFQRLFVTLFGGGEASLHLIESDDPLDAGLEIIARPPGKKPQSLSLLSGGEQALTAMALIFAIFLTNPAPLCVLDEVDAPLDDANVERFCDLLDAMRSDTDTRFLVVTHNPVTMSRMDRLFGVTMAERGVSQLVSVDLEAAEQLLEAAG